MNPVMRCTGSVLLQMHCCSDRPLVLTCAALAGIILPIQSCSASSKYTLQFQPYVYSLILFLSWEANLILPKGQLNTHERQKFIEFLVPKGISRDLL